MTFNADHIRQIESLRRSKVLVIAASYLQPDILPELYDFLQRLENCQRLDVLVYGRGGEANTARRMAHLLNGAAERVSFIVPYLCHSSLTLLALSGEEIVAGDMTEFSPIDPRLNAGEGNGEGAPDALAAEDIRMFAEMAEKWFGVTDEDNRMQILSAIAGSVFPSTLTSLYRSTAEIRMIATEMLNLHFKDPDQEQVASIVDQLLHRYHSHSYSITSQQMAAFGVNLTHHQDVMRSAWQTVKNLREFIGGEALTSPEQPRIDVFFSTAEASLMRKRSPGNWKAEWQTTELDIHDNTIFCRS